MCDNSNGHQLLSVVSAVHHERVGQTLNDGALCLSETLDGVATGGVREVDGLADLNVIAVVRFQLANVLANHSAMRDKIRSILWVFGATVRQRDIPNLDILVAPLVEQLDAANLARDILWQDLVGLLALDLDFAGV